MGEPPKKKINKEKKPIKSSRNVEPLIKKIVTPVVSPPQIKPQIKPPIAKGNAFRNRILSSRLISH